MRLILTPLASSILIPLVAAIILPPSSHGNFYVRSQMDKTIGLELRVHDARDVLQARVDSLPPTPPQSPPPSRRHYCGASRTKIPDVKGNDCAYEHRGDGFKIGGTGPCLGVGPMSTPPTSDTLGTCYV